jgi:hypothetical protein
MPITGADFEELVQPFFKLMFEKLGFIVIQVRKQTSGTQNGFDISVSVLDRDSGTEYEFFFECKYYTTANLEWAEIFNKQLQLEASCHKPTAFIALSPLCNLSNINHNIQSKIVEKFKYPVDFWTPDKDIDKMFALDRSVYERVFDKKCDFEIDEDKEVERMRLIIKKLIERKKALQYLDIVRIETAARDPSEEYMLKTTLDDKLNSIMKDDDYRRIEYHQIRVDYKVYLEDLVDVNPTLRDQIINWENNLRLKADRLTNNFKLDNQYTPAKFFHDFFQDAEKEILTFYKDFSLKGDKERLLYGVILELAAQCPLDWSKDERN